MKTLTTREQRAATVLATVTTNLNQSTECMLNVGRALSEINHERYYTLWGYDTFQSWVKERCGLKLRKAQYLICIAKGANTVKVDIKKIAPLGIAKLREIFSLDHTKDKERILALIKRASTMSLEEIKMATSKGTTRNPRTSRLWAFTSQQLRVVDAAIEAVQSETDMLCSDAIAEICSVYLQMTARVAQKRKAA